MCGGEGRGGEGEGRGGRGEGRGGEGRGGRGEGRGGERRGRGGEGRGGRGRVVRCYNFTACVVPSQVREGDEVVFLNVANERYMVSTLIGMGGVTNWNVGGVTVQNVGGEHWLSQQRTPVGMWGTPFKIVFHCVDIAV